MLRFGYLAGPSIEWTLISAVSNAKMMTKGYITIGRFGMRWISD